MISLVNASKRFGPKLLFEGVNWLITPQDRVGLVGANGTGKSTVMKILAGLETVDSGEYSTQKGVTAGYLPQDGLALSGRSVFNECLSVFDRLKDMEKEMETIAHSLSDLDPHSDEYHDYRGYAGRVAGGILKPGDEIIALPSGFGATITAIDTADGAVSEAYAPMSVTIRIDSDLDISRGDMLVRPNNMPHIGQDLELMVCWLGKQKMVLRGKYILKHTHRDARCMITDIKYKLNINTLHRMEGINEIGMNDIARISIRSTQPLFYDSYRRNRVTGSLILIDESTNETVAAGMIV